jgi:hypothetical protein
MIPTGYQPGHIPIYYIHLLTGSKNSKDRFFFSIIMVLKKNYAREPPVLSRLFHENHQLFHENRPLLMVFSNKQNQGFFYSDFFGAKEPEQSQFLKFSKNWPTLGLTTYLLTTLPTYLPTYKTVS